MNEINEHSTQLEQSTDKDSKSHVRDRNTKNMFGMIQMPLYFALVLLIGWFPWYFFSTPSVFIWAPTLAAIIIAALYGGRREIKAIFTRLVVWKAHIKWYFFIIMIPAITAILAVGVHVAMGGTAPTFPLFKENQGRILMVFFVFLFPLTSSAFFEEIGFRGYALPKLQERWGPLLGTLILGVFFGAWLLPEFYNPTSAQYALGLGYYGWFIVTEIAWSIIMTWVFNRTKGSSLIAGYLFHAMFNAWPFLLLTDAIPGMDLPLLDIQLFRIFTIVVSMAAVTLIIITKGTLGFQNSERLT